MSAREIVRESNSAENEVGITQGRTRKNMKIIAHQKHMILLAFCLSGSISHAENQLLKSSSTLAGIADEQDKERNADRWKAQEAFLEDNAVPESKRDIERIQKDFESPQDYFYQRALRWLDRIKDPGLAGEVRQLLNNEQSKFPPNSTTFAQSMDNATTKRHVEIAAHLMQKLAGLKDQLSISLIRPYTQQKQNQDLYLVAMKSLDDLDDPELYGQDKHYRALAGKVDPNDKDTKVWLMQNMLSNPSIEIKRQAGLMYSEKGADPTSADDIQFARKILITSKDGTNQGYGCRILERRIQAGYPEQQDFDEAVNLLKSPRTNHSGAINMLGALGQYNQYRPRVLKVLRDYCQTPMPNTESTKAAANEFISRLAERS